MEPESLAKSGTEHGHQTSLFAWAALNTKQFPALVWMFAIKNAEKAGKIAGAMAKAEGVRAGVSDIFLPWAAKGCHGLFIEMKKPGEKAKPNQLEFGKEMQNRGFGFVVCDHWEKARDILIEYLS